MTEKQNALINELFSSLPKDEEKGFRQIVGFLTELGYIPQKQRVRDFDLSFKHSLNGKVIAKIGIRKNKGCLRIKFFACRDVPANTLRLCMMKLSQA